jgi:hypothetical protein
VLEGIIPYHPRLPYSRLPFSYLLQTCDSGLRCLGTLPPPAFTSFAFSAARVVNAFVSKAFKGHSSCFARRFTRLVSSLFVMIRYVILRNSDARHPPLPLFCSQNYREKALFKRPDVPPRLARYPRNTMNFPVWHFVLACAASFGAGIILSGCSLFVLCKMMNRHELIEIKQDKD